MEQHMDYQAYYEESAYNLGYAQYQVMPQPHLQQQQYMIQQQQQQQQLAGYPPSPPPHVALPISPSSPPPDIYDHPLSPSISGSDTSAEYQSSGANSPSSSRGASLVHRTNIRYNPTPSPTSSSGRRGRGRSSRDSDDEDIMGVAYTENLANSRKEATRRQRIEAEQRRRDELRDGYAKLKDVLPVSNQKSSKVSLLERATHHIIALEKTNKDLQARVTLLEQELQRLRALNEKISLNANETPSPGMFDARPLSPPPDVPIQTHLLRGQPTPDASEDY